MKTKTIKQIIIRRILSVILIFSGVMLILWPWIEDKYHDRQADALTNAYLESLSIVSDTRSSAEADDMLRIHADDSRGANPLPSDDLMPENNEIMLKTLNQNEWPVEAILRIPKISFMMPVLSDASEKHLNVSVSSITGTPKPWLEHGNYVVVGHRSRGYGRHFNRLDELDVNDQILVMDSQKNEYRYVVTKTIIVPKTDVSVIASAFHDELTLITCDPANQKDPENRLVVKAKKT